MWGVRDRAVLYYAIQGDLKHATFLKTLHDRPAHKGEVRCMRGFLAGLRFYLFENDRPMQFVKPVH